MGAKGPSDRGQGMRLGLTMFLAGLQGFFDCAVWHEGIL